MCAHRPPVAFSIAGTDPSGGAGIHADLKTFTARGAVGTAVITALLAQNTHGVSRIYPVDEDFVAEQLRSVLDDMPVDATKSGMLGSSTLVKLVAQHRQDFPLGFYTVDPVMVAKSGHRLLALDAVQTLRSELLPVTDLMTPNLPEAALLLGDDVPQARTLRQARQQARELVARGAGAVLLKGGHGASQEVVDVLATSDGRTDEFTHPRVSTANTHGTGCTLSAAIVANVATRKCAAGRQHTDPEMLHGAVADALDYLSRALVSAANWRVSLDPTGACGPVDHTVDVASAQS